MNSNKHNCILGVPNLLPRSRRLLFAKRTDGPTLLRSLLQDVTQKKAMGIIFRGIKELVLARSKCVIKNGIVLAVSSYIDN